MNDRLQSIRDHWLGGDYCNGDRVCEQAASDIETLLDEVDTLSNAYDRLWLDVLRMYPDFADRTLREAGLDPEKIGQNIENFVKQFFANDAIGPSLTASKETIEEVQAEMDKKKSLAAAVKRQKEIHQRLKAEIEEGLDQNVLMDEDE